MKHKVILSLLLGLIAASMPHAQTQPRLSAAELDAERSRIAAERSTLEQRGVQERTACYQKFAVQDCLNESRRRSRAALDQLRRDDARVNDIERRERGNAALERLDQKNAPQPTQDTAARRAQALKSQQDRMDRAAGQAAGRASEAAQAADRRRAFEDKQRSHADRQTRQAERRVEAPKERERHEDKLRRAAEHEAERERRNAERKKPRAAALPPAS